MFGLPAETAKAKRQTRKNTTGAKPRRQLSAEAAPLAALFDLYGDAAPLLAIASTDEPPQAAAHAPADNIIPFHTTGHQAAAIVTATETGDAAPADAQAEIIPTYCIKDVAALMTGGLKTRFRRNVEAIRLLRQIVEEGREATDEEKDALTRFAGWGSLPQLFGTDEDSQWENERAELRALLNDAEYEAARQSTINAHYTSPAIVTVMWEMAERMGFAGGRVQEAGCGVGFFIGLCPPHVAARSRFTGIELDPITAGIAAAIYPQAHIQNKAFQQVAHLDSFYDLAIGNVPFADVPILSDSRYNKARPSLHDYFVWRSVDEVRPGGFIMLLTSTGTLDKQDNRVRAEIARKADLIAALRFPEKTHKANAGTDVCTDLLILRRRFDGEQAACAEWLNVVEVAAPDGGDAIPVNQYYAAHPEQILGRLDRTGTMYRGNNVNVSRTDDFEERLAAAIERLPQAIYVAAETAAARPRNEAAPEAVKEHGFLIRDGGLYVRECGVLVEHDCDRETFRIIADTIAVRDTLRALFDAQLSGAGDIAISTARHQLNIAYDRFVSWHGPLNAAKNKKAFATDPDAPLVLALEHYNRKRNRATKAEVFYRDTIRTFRRADAAASVSEALAISLNEAGRLDVDRMAQLLRRTPAAVRAELVESALAFNDAVEGWQPASLYLSGNVRQKLDEAREAAAIDPQFAPNVAALEPIIPPDIDRTEIEVKLGAPWIPTADVVQFMCELLGAEPDAFELHFMPNQGSWLVGYTLSGERLHEYKSAATEIYGTSRANFIEVMQAALNNKSILIYDEDEAGTRHVNHEESAAATAKVREVRDLFKSWIWEDEARAERLQAIYNVTYNSIVPVSYDGSHLTFPGLNVNFKPRPHQKNAVWRAICTGRAALSYSVGSGKTACYIIAALELKRLGLARKPMLAVLKSTIGQITATARELYPHARILSTEDKFDARNRKQTIAQMATMDFDLLILTHDQLDMLKMTPETQEQFIRHEIDDLEYVMELAKDEGGKGGSRIVKRLEKAKERLEERIREAVAGGHKDDVVYFEELGVDFLLVDEFHYYKSLPCHTAQDRIKGVPTSRSDRATNMYMRTAWLLKQNRRRGLVVGSGTIISNSLAELFILQQYLQRHELESRNIHTFDSWSNVFAEVQSRLEVGVTGEYGPVARLAAFVNLPELMSLVREVMDVKLIENMEDIKRPRKEEVVVTSQISERQRAYLKQLQARAAIVRSSKPIKGGDNMLSITTDARKLSADARLVMPGAPDEPDSKLNLLVANVLRLFHEKPQERVQFIFSDIGIYDNKWGLSVYHDIKTKLIAGGIPAERIVDFSALTDKGRERAIARLKSGEAAIAIGSTQRAGTGINAAEFAVACHHFDVPWLPAHVEQRDGRVWRHGNLHYEWNEAVMIFRYVCVGSFDQFSWQVIDNKQKFINQIMVEGPTQRTYKEEDTEELSPATLMAIASGNPDLLLKVQLDEKVAELRAARRRHERSQNRLKQEAAWTARSIEKVQREIAELLSDSDHARKTDGHDFQMTVEGNTYTGRKQAAINLTVACSRDRFFNGERELATIRGFTVMQRGYDVFIRREGEYGFKVNTEAPLGTLASIESVLRNIGGRIQAAQDNLRAYETNYEKTVAATGKPFKQAAELEHAEAELAEVTARLKATGQADDAQDEMAA
ncbi:MAG TPA: helicase-related protein [Blastocatellia bacterium]|nr:helicase-related protein [Blastocatellia bacterium]